MVSFSLLEPMSTVVDVHVSKILISMDSSTQHLPRRLSAAKRRLTGSDTSCWS
jgi:hypothetical protein